MLVRTAKYERLPIGSSLAKADTGYGEVVGYTHSTLSLFMAMLV